MKKEKKLDFKSSYEKKRTLQIPTDVLNESDSIDLDLVKNSSEKEMVLGRNSRCVSVATISSAPKGRREKRVFKGKGAKNGYNEPLAAE